MFAAGISSVLLICPFVLLVLSQRWQASRFPLLPLSGYVACVAVVCVGA